MASLYNFNAESSRDVIMKPGEPMQEEASRLLSELAPVNAWEHSGHIKKTPPEIAPRSIKIDLELADATAVTPDSITWNVNIPVIGKLAVGTLVTWTEIASNQTDICDWGLFGVNCHSYSLGNLTGVLTGRFERISNNIFCPNPQTLPISATLKDTNVLLNGQITVKRLSGSFNLSKATFFRTTIVFSEH
jgi:hypothetical protein